MRLEGWHIVIIIVIAILLFGAPKLPGLARSVGQSLRIFKSEVKQMKDDDKAPDNGADSPVEGRVVNNPPQNGTSSAHGSPNASGNQYPNGSDQPPADRQ